jgi:hypothetical protein
MTMAIQAPAFSSTACPHALVFRKIAVTVISFALAVPPLALAEQDQQARRRVRGAPIHVDDTYRRIAQETGGQVYTIDPKASAHQWSQLGERMAADMNSLSLACGDSVTLSDTLAIGSQTIYGVTLPTGVRRMHAAVAGGSGKTQILVRRGARPSLDTFDTASDAGHAAEVQVSVASGERWYINVVPMAAIRDKRLRVGCDR